MSCEEGPKFADLVAGDRGPPQSMLMTRTADAPTQSRMPVPSVYIATISLLVTKRSWEANAASASWAMLIGGGSDQGRLT